MAKINIKGMDIAVISIDKKDYISLTDMVRNIKKGLVFVEKWLINKNTIEFIGIWEEMYNPDFNFLEYERIKNATKLNCLILSVKQWIGKTNSVDIGLLWRDKISQISGTLYEILKKSVHLQH